MQEIRNKCFGSKNLILLFIRRKLVNMSAAEKQQRTNLNPKFEMDCKKYFSVLVELFENYLKSVITSLI